ncbi:MAG: DUF1566 domain-containing protein, partial [Tannerellaceae bacterium]|nr:DUF1566 domain-containing protein [Tannerellaceae bacterium]
SVSGDVPGTLYADEYPITVVFADDINNIVINKGKSTAKLCAVFREGTGSSAVDKYVSLTITVQDCSCCPLNVAKVVEDAAYEGADVMASVADVVHFAQIPGAALCVWKVNQGKPVDGIIGNSWGDANIKCTQTMAAEGYGDGWRLPNIAEMYYKLHQVFFKDGGNISSTYGTASRFLSNTVREGDRDMVYFTRSRTGEDVIIDGSSAPKEKPFNANFRCVKTINY